MEFVYEKLEHLPKLAWCARVVRHLDTVQVFHGSQVETRPTGFVEGAWNGPFESLSLSTATVLCGTGAQLEGSRVRFCASSDRLSPLFSIAKHEAIWVSNSPLFVLSAAGEKPNSIYPFYMYDLIQMWRHGLYNLSGRLKTSSNSPMCVHFGAIRSIGADLSSSLDARPLGPPFHDFDSYRNRLIEGVREAARNAADPHRTTPFGLLAALSQGYDSCATAAAGQARRMHQGNDLLRFRAARSLF